MTDYELTNLFFQAVQTGNGTMANYMTLIFGMLVSSYLAAHRLDRWMMVIAILIYSMFALGFCNEIYQVYSDFARLGLTLAERGIKPGNDLGWFGPVAVGSGGLQVIPKMVLVMTLLAYFGSMVFFFRARSANLKQNIGPREPGDTLE